MGWFDSKKKWFGTAVTQSVFKVETGVYSKWVSRHILDAVLAGTDIVDAIMLANATSPYNTSLNTYKKLSQQEHGKLAIRTKSEKWKHPDHWIEKTEVIDELTPPSDMSTVIPVRLDKKVMYGDAITKADLAMTGSGLTTDDIISSLKDSPDIGLT